MSTEQRNEKYRRDMASAARFIESFCDLLAPGDLPASKGRARDLAKRLRDYGCIPICGRTRTAKFSHERN